MGEHAIEVNTGTLWLLVGQLVVRNVIDPVQSLPSDVILYVTPVTILRTAAIAQKGTWLLLGVCVHAYVHTCVCTTRPMPFTFSLSIYLSVYLLVYLLVVCLCDISLCVCLMFVELYADRSHHSYS